MKIKFWVLPVVLIVLVAAFFWDYILKFLILGVLVLSLDSGGKENYKQLQSCNWWPDSYVTINNITLRIPRKERPIDSTNKYERFEETKCAPAVVDKVEIREIEFAGSYKTQSYDLGRVFISDKLDTYGWSNELLNQFLSNLENYPKGEYIKFSKYGDFFTYVPEEAQQAELTAIHHFKCSDRDFTDARGNNIGRNCRSFAKTDNGLYIYYFFNAKITPDLHWLEVEKLIKSRIQAYVEYGNSTTAYSETGASK